MIIIKDEDVIMHFGVIGMKWGVRRDAYLERERAVRTKAQNIIDVAKQQLTETKSRKGINMLDIKAAGYMTQTMSKKITTAVLSETLGQVMMGMYTGKFNNILSNPKELAKMIGNIAARSALTLGLREAQARPSLRRYTDKGTKDLSKKQYKFFTPEALRTLGIKIGISLAPMASFMARATLQQVAKKGAESRKRAEQWSGHLLGTKTSNLHTIYSDPEGYMSILEKIPKG